MEKENAFAPMENDEQEAFIADRNVIMKIKTAESAFKPVFMYDVQAGRPKAAFNAYVPKVEEDNSFLGRIKRDVFKNLSDNPSNMVASAAKGTVRGGFEGVVNIFSETVKEAADWGASIQTAGYDPVINNQKKVLKGMMRAEKANTPEGNAEIRKMAQKIANLENLRDTAGDFADEINLTMSNMQKRWVEMLDKVSVLKKDDDDNALFYDLGTGITSLGAAVGLTFLTKNPVTAAKAFGLSAQSSFYNELRENGASTSEALAFSIPAGIAEGALEKIGIHVLVENMAVRGMGSSILRNMFSEAIQEFSQQTASNTFRLSANRFTGADIETPDSVAAFLYDGVYAGILGGMTAAPVSVGGGIAAHYQSRGTAAKFEQAGLDKQSAKSVAGYLIYNERAAEFANALSEAKITGNIEPALEVFNKNAGVVEDKTGKKFWSVLDDGQKEDFIYSLIVSQEKIVSDSIQIANDMLDPDTDEMPTSEGMAKNFVEAIDGYKTQTQESISEMLDKRIEEMEKASEKSRTQREILDSRKDLSKTDKKIIGDMLEAFNVSVADKFGAESISGIDFKTQTPEVDSVRQEEFIERAGIYQYEQGLTREEAESLAMRDIFGEERREADAFIETYRENTVYDEIPFFQNRYDEFMRDAVFSEIEETKVRNKERKNREFLYQTAEENERVIEISGKEFGEYADINDLRRKAYRYFKENLQGKFVRHPVLGNIKFIRKGIDKIKSSSADADKLKLVPKIKEIIETADYLRSEASNKPHRDNIARFHYLANKVDFGGEILNVFISVAEDNEGNFFYNINKDKKTSSKDTAVQMRSNEEEADNSAVNLNIAQSGTKSNLFYQPSDTVRGAYDPSERILYLMKQADPSTLVHELGHHFTMQYIRLLKEHGKTTEIEGILKWLGAKSANDITVEQWEKLADAFIVYTKEGYAPSSKLDDLFAAMKKYLANLYEKLVIAAGRLPEINDDVRTFFDTMLSVDNKAQADFKEMLKKTRDLREVVKGVLKGEALEINGLRIDDVKHLVQTLHIRLPKPPKTLEQKIRQAGGIDIDFARSLDLISLVGAGDEKFGKNGLFKRRGTIRNEALLVEFLKSEGFLQEADSAQAVSEQWLKAEEILENAAITYSPSDTKALNERENAEAAIKVAHETLEGIDYDALLEGLSAFSSVGAVGASKDIVKYIESQLKQIQTQAKRINKKLVSEAKRDTTRLVRREMKQAAKEERDTLKERQKEIISFIRSYPIEDKNKLISSVQKAFTAKSLADILAEVSQKAEKYYETEKRRRLKSKINMLVKRTKPSGLKNQKFDYDRNTLFAKIREFSKLTQDKAAEELSKQSSGNTETSAEDLLLMKYLIFKVKGMDASSSLMESLLFDLESVVESGHYAKEQADFTRRWNLSNQKTDVAEAVTERAKKRGSVKGNLKTRSGNVYRAFTNIYSMLNSIGGKELAETYGKKAELLSNEIQTAIFNVERDFTSESLRILGFKSAGDMFNMIADLKKQKVTLGYQQESMNGATFETDALGLLDIYNAIKNEKTREDYARVFGMYELPDGTKRLFVEDLINENLTFAQKEWADLMMETVNSYYDGLNRAFISMHGTDLPKTENYWPSTSEHFKETELEAQFTDSINGNPSFIKERAKSGVIPRPSNAYLKFVKHVEGAENFIRMGVFYKDMRDTFNSLRVSTSIKNTYGDGVYKNLIKLIDNLWAFNRTGGIGPEEGWFNMLINNWVTAKIAVNPSVYVTQMTGLLNYFENVPVKDFVTGFVEGITHPKRTAEYMIKAAPFLEARFAGGYNEALQRVLRSADSGYSLGIFSPKLKYNAKNALSFLVRLGDKQAIVYGGYAYMKYLTEKKGLSVEEAAKEFEFATLRAQSAGTAGSISTFQASGTGFLKLTMSFKNTPLQFLRKIVDAWDMYRNGDISTAQFVKIETIYIGVVSAAFVLSKYILSQAVDALTGAPDDEDDEERLLWDLINQMAFGMFDGIPLAGDFVKYLAKSAEGQARYYDSVISMPMFDDLERAGRKLLKEEKTGWDIADIMVPFLEILTGAPAGTAVRYTKKAIKED